MGSWERAITPPVLFIVSIPTYAVLDPGGVKRDHVPRPTGEPPAVEYGPQLALANGSGKAEGTSGYLKVIVEETLAHMGGWMLSAVGTMV